MRGRLVYHGGAGFAPAATVAYGWAMADPTDTPGAHADPHTDAPADPAAAKHRVTLKHVAQASGLGVTTVSDILNGRDGERTRYSKQTQAKVHRVVAELGYTVDRAAQQLRRGRSGVVGLLFTRHLLDSFFARTLDLAEGELRRRGYNLMLAIGHGHGVEDRVEQLRQERVEGIIFGPAYDVDDVAPLLASDVPAVVFGGKCGGRFDEAYIDHAAARRLAVQHLLGLGHRRVGFLELHRSKSPAVEDDAARLAAMGVGGGDWWVPDSGTQDAAAVYDAAAAFARRWQAADPADRPTAVLCHDDHTAAVALSAFWAAGVRVPADLSVVGCNDVPTARYLVPPLTTVDLHVERQMAAAVDLLVDRLAHPDSPAAAVRVEPELVVRASTRAA